MQKYTVCLLALVYTFLVPVHGSAQALSSISIGTVEIQPSVRIGYQHLTLNMTLPLPYPDNFASFWDPSGLDFSIPNANIGVGGLRVDVRRGPYSVFVDAEGSANGSVRISTPSEPFLAGNLPVDWTGTRLEWWSLSGGGSIGIGTNTSVIGGIKAEHLSLRLSDPTDPVGFIQESIQLYGEQYSGDLSIKLWVPYFGLQMAGINFKAAFIFSPCTWADVSIPFRYVCPDPWMAVGYGDARYMFKRSGILLEGVFDYQLPMSSNTGCTLWAKASWCQISGRGSEDYRFDYVDQGVPVFSIGGSQSINDGTFSFRGLAGGLSLLHTF